METFCQQLGIFSILLLWHAYYWRNLLKTSFRSFGCCLLAVIQVAVILTFFAPLAYVLGAILGVASA